MLNVRVLMNGSLNERGSRMKEQCFICGSMVEDVSGICPVCGAVLGRSTQVNPADMNMGGTTGQPNNTMNGGQVVYQNPNMGFNTGAYNYQNPNMTLQPNGKKKVVFSILSIVFAVIGVLTVCFPVVSLIFCVASIVFGIIALVKKQIKVPAVLGIVFSGIAGMISVVMLCLNLIMMATVGTDVKGIFQQSFDVLEEGCIELTNVVLEVPIGTGADYLILYADGRYSTSGDSGTYRCVSYADETAQFYIKNQTMFAMMQGYEMKNLTAIELTSNSGGTSYYCFVVPETYVPGDTIYYVDGTGDNYTSYNLRTATTIPLSDFSY